LTSFEEIGVLRDGRTWMIAELSANHGHSLDIAKRSVEAAAKAGADAIKVQTYTPDTITIDSDEPFFRISQGTLWDGRTLYDLYREAYMPWEWQPDLMRVAGDLGVEFFSSPFDRTAVEFLESLGMRLYKVASFEIVDVGLIAEIASTGKPGIISTGIATSDDIVLALEAWREAGGSELALLKCTSAYPAPLGELNLRTIPDMSVRFQVPVGLSDHSLGSEAAIAAVALGARIVEKHFTLDRSLGGPDAAFSVEPAEFKAMVESVRKTESALGRPTYEPTARASASREHARSLFVVADIVSGDVFTAANVRSIRPGNGLHPRWLPNVMGLQASRDIKRGEPLSWDLVEGGESVGAKPSTHPLPESP
jgi:pseudaminic acid synthase